MILMTLLSKQAATFDMNSSFSVAFEYVMCY